MFYAVFYSPWWHIVNCLNCKQIGLFPPLHLIWWQLNVEPCTDAGKQASISDDSAVMWPQWALAFLPLLLSSDTFTGSTPGTGGSPFPWYFTKPRSQRIYFFAPKVYISRRIFQARAAQVLWMQACCCQFDMLCTLVNPWSLMSHSCSVSEVKLATAVAHRSVSLAPCHSWNPLDTSTLLCGYY